MGLFDKMVKGVATVATAPVRAVCAPAHYIMGDEKTSMADTARWVLDPDDGEELSIKGRDSASKDVVRDFEKKLDDFMFGG